MKLIANYLVVFNLVAIYFKFNLSFSIAVIYSNGQIVTDTITDGSLFIMVENIHTSFYVLKAFNNNLKHIY